MDSKKKGKIRIDFYIEQRGVCPYCKEHIDFKYWTLDHKIPLSRGGGNKLKNLIGCCTFCNAIKADRTFMIVE